MEMGIFLLSQLYKIFLEVTQVCVYSKVSKNIKEHKNC